MILTVDSVGDIDNALQFRWTEVLGASHYDLLMDGRPLSQIRGLTAGLLATYWMVPGVSYEFNVRALDATNVLLDEARVRWIFDPRRSTRARGSRSFVLVRFHFPDVAPVPAAAAAQASGSLAALFAAESWGSFTLATLDPTASFQMPEPFSFYADGTNGDYATNRRDLFAHSTQILEEMGIEADYIYRIYARIANRGNSNLWAGEPGMTPWSMAHEIAHDIGLMHSGATAVAPEDLTNIPVSRYGHIYSIMGAGDVPNHRFSLFKKTVLGWRPNRYEWVHPRPPGRLGRPRPVNGTFLLDDALSNPDALELRLALPQKGAFYSLEYRAELGGVLIQLHLGQQNDQVYTYSDVDFALIGSAGAVWTPGEEFIDPYRNIHVRVIRLSSSSATVEVTI